MTAPQTAATPATAWRQQAQAGELFTLPGSGNIARIRRPSLMALAVQAGHVPNTLSDNVMRFLALDEPAKSEAAKVDNYRRNVQAFVEVAALCLVEPRLILDREPDYGAGEIGPQDVHDRDYLFIYYDVCQGPSRALDPFRLASHDA